MTYGIYSVCNWIIRCSISWVFAVGIFTKRTNTFGVICGLILGIIFAYVYNGVGKGNSPFYVSTISFTVAFVFAYILSFIVPSKHKRYNGINNFEKDKPSTYISKRLRKSRLL